MLSKILVTGGNGFIGSHLIEYYSRKGVTVHSLDLADESIIPDHKYYSINITNFDEINRVDDSFDIIFHCAGSASVPSSVKNPLDNFNISTKKIRS